jgi:hypothetical protein
MENQHIIAFGKGLGSIPINISTSFTVLTQNSVAGDLRCLIKGVVYIYIYFGDGDEKF